MLRFALLQVLNGVRTLFFYHMGYRKHSPDSYRDHIFFYMFSTIVFYCAEACPDERKGGSNPTLYFL